MSNVITVGKRFIPREQIALVEPFEVNPNSTFQTSRTYEGRLVLVSSESMLIEETAEAFAEAHQFKLLAADRIAINPEVRFQVESFAPGKDFNPTKPFVSRLLWRDFDGNRRSKLLLSEPEAVLAVIAPEDSGASVTKIAATRKGSRRRSRTPKDLNLHP